MLTHKTDVILIFEIHMTTLSYRPIKILNYVPQNNYDTRHPCGKVHRGTAVIVRSSIKNYGKNKNEDDHQQATSVVLEDLLGALTI